MGPLYESRPTDSRLSFLAPSFHKLIFKMAKRTAAYQLTQENFESEEEEENGGNVN